MRLLFDVLNVTGGARFNQDSSSLRAVSSKRSKSNHAAAAAAAADVKKTGNREHAIRSGLERGGQDCATRWPPRANNFVTQSADTKKVESCLLTAAAYCY